MSTTDIIILSIILLLAIPFGYFLRKALFQNETENLQADLREALQLTNSQKKEIQALREKNTILSSKLETLQNEFYALTLAYKELQSSIHDKGIEILNQEYDVPPQLPHLEESVSLLSSEITRLREKIKKWQTRDYIRENKKLKSKLIKAKLAYNKLDKKSKTLDKYKNLYTKIQDLNKTAESLFIDTKPKKKKAKKTKNTRKNSLFSQQPDIRKKLIFNEILNSEKPNSPSTTSTPFDLKPKVKKSRPVNKGLIDLIGIDNEIVQLLNENGILSFEELVDTKIGALSTLLVKARKNPSDYEYHTWPIQASLALKGEWNIIEDYRKKL